jgi:hypothetical protein
LDAEDNDFGRGFTDELEGDHEVCEAKLVNGGLAGHAPERIAFQADDGAGLAAGIDGVENEQLFDPGEMGEEIEAMRAAIHENDAGRHARVTLQTRDGMDADAVVGVNNISESEDECVHGL